MLGASSYTDAEAIWTQRLPDWIGAHGRMFSFLGGVPRLVVPDNLKSGVNKASFYDPEINRSYGQMAAHYGVSVLPARPRRPKDKAKVEAEVRFAQSYILGRLRHQTFFSLAEANQAIAVMVARINDHVMRRLGLSRRHLFETVERPALGALPATDYEYAEWGRGRVSLDYHVEVAGFFYSVPHHLIRNEVDSRATARMVEIFFQGNQVAVHQRRYAGARHGTAPEHMPSAHRRYAEWTPEWFRGGRDRRSTSSICVWPEPPPIAAPLAKAPIGRSGTMYVTAWSAARIARIRRRSQRTPLGKVMSGPRSLSAATSMLCADNVTATLSSTEASKPGCPAARKSGRRLNVW